MFLLEFDVIKIKYVIPVQGGESALATDCTDGFVTACLTLMLSHTVLAEN